MHEDATASGFESGHQLEVQLGHICSNRCVHCVSGQLNEAKKARPRDTEPVRRALEDAAAAGIKRVTFLGGEPTIHPDFLSSLRLAVELGFDDVVIFTNGVRGEDPTFLDQVLALGRFTWRVSLHGGSEEAHERTTQRKGSWRRLMAALDHLAARREHLTANMCVNAYNYRSMSTLPDLVLSRAISELHIDTVRPVNAGDRSDEQLRALLVRYRDLSQPLDELLETFAARAPRFDVSIGNLPYCLLPAWADRVEHGGDPTLTLTTGHTGELDSILRKYQHQRLDAVWAPSCAQCIFRARCRGVPEKYAELFGTDELRPLSYQSLAEADPNGRAFAIRVVPSLAPVLETDPPPGWTRGAARSMLRDRRVAVPFEHSGGDKLTLVFTEPGKATPEARPWRTTSEYLLSVRARDEFDRAAAKQLLGWAKGRLRL